MHTVINAAAVDTANTLLNNILQHDQTRSHLGSLLCDLCITHRNLLALLARPWSSQSVPQLYCGGRKRYLSEERTLRFELRYKICRSTVAIFLSTRTLLPGSFLLGLLGEDSIVTVQQIGSVLHVLCAVLYLHLLDSRIAMQAGYKRRSTLTYTLAFAFLCLAFAFAFTFAFEFKLGYGHWLDVQ